jgi:hypothetical protein
MQPLYGTARPKRVRAHTRVSRLAVVLVTSAALFGCKADTLYKVEQGQVTVNLTPLAVSVTTTSMPRMERTDSLHVQVTVDDRSGKRGIGTVGATVVVTGAGGSVSALTNSRSYDPKSTTGLVTASFAFSLPVGAQTTLPDTLQVQAYGYAIDGQNLCVASASSSEQRLSCGTYQGATVGLDTEGELSDVVAVRGETVLLPSPGLIADAVVDPVRQRLYLSNLTHNRLEVLDLGTTQFMSPVEVGSEPWGLGLNRTGDTLFVANSGGTNISFVPLSSLTEDTGRRLKTPNEVLYQIEVVKDQELRTRYLPSFVDFSDRPQFLAQDYTGRILYSTVPTVAGPLGTIRYVDSNPDPGSTSDQPEVYFLFTTDAVTPTEGTWAIANIDSLKVFVDPAGVGSDKIALFDHKPGYPSQLILSDTTVLEQAVSDIQAKGSDILATPGRWNPDVLGLSDTTYVSVSGDRHWVAFGEGARSPAGRIILYDAANRVVSRAINVVDLVNNASERVTGVDLNYDGTFGIARGVDAAYFFNNDLRLQGLFAPGVAGGAGAALQPIAQPVVPALAYVGANDESIKIIDTLHFLQRGDIPIRDDLVGPLRAAAPLPSDNAGLSCPGDLRCVTVKLYGITSAGGVVIVNVRQGDLH